MIRTDDIAVQIYMRDIGAIARVSAEEERALALRVMKGDDAARDLLIRSNLRLVVAIALEYAGYQVPLLDLISEGNMGLMKAVERFNPDRGCKLGTYAAWWIRQSVLKALVTQGRLVRLPFHIQRKLTLMRRAIEALSSSLGREPLEAEVAEAMGVKPEQLRQWQQSAVLPMSMDVDEDEWGSRPRSETIGDSQAIAPDVDVSSRQLKEWMASLVHTLDPRARRILLLRFGLNGEKEETLREIGRRLNLTRERVRQIQEEALKQLRRLMERESVMCSAA